MTIRVYTISQFLFCPYKLYLKQHYDGINEYEKTGENKKIPSLYPLLKYLNQDFEDIMRSNLWKVDLSMDKEEIKNILSQEAYSFIENTLDSINLDYDTKDLTELKKKWIWDLKLEVEILALRIFKIMRNSKKSGREIGDMLFPPSLNSYLIYDKCLDLSGIVDKIEIVDGNYFPVKMKYGNAPLRGVWESDALEMVAYALLTEREFEVEVNVGFVEYAQLGNKRPVLIDSEIRESFFNLMDEVRKIVYDHEYPDIVQNLNKCKVCEYQDLCNTEPIEYKKF